MAVDMPLGCVCTSPDLTQASDRETWSGSYLPSSHKHSSDMDLGDAQVTIKVSNLLKWLLHELPCWNQRDWTAPGRQLDLSPSPTINAHTQLALGLSTPSRENPQDRKASF